MAETEIELAEIQKQVLKATSMHNNFLKELGLSLLAGDGLEPGVIQGIGRLVQRAVDDGSAGATNHGTLAVA